MRPLSEATSRITGQSFNRKYVALGRIVNAWADIVGKDFASKAQPVKIRYRKKERREKPEATLEIAVNSANATLLHYQKDLILERINQIFGDRWISTIRFVTITSNQDGFQGRKTKIPLTSAEKNTLSHMLEDIADDDIRDRLQNLGQAVIMDNKE